MLICKCWKVGLRRTKLIYETRVGFCASPNRIKHTVNVCIFPRVNKIFSPVKRKHPNANFVRKRKKKKGFKTTFARIPFEHFFKNMMFSALERFILMLFG